jgi:hypothetical protein
MLGSSRVAAQLAASQEELSSVSERERERAVTSYLFTKNYEKMNQAMGLLHFCISNAIKIDYTLVPSLIRKIYSRI